MSTSIEDRLVKTILQIQYVLFNRAPHYLGADTLVFHDNLEQYLRRNATIAFQDSISAGNRMKEIHGNPNYLNIIDDERFTVYNDGIALTWEEACRFSDLLNELDTLVDSTAQNNVNDPLSRYVSTLKAFRNRSFFECDFQQLQREFEDWLRQYGLKEGLTPSDEAMLTAVYEKHFHVPQLAFPPDSKRFQLMQLAQSYSRLLTHKLQETKTSKHPEDEDESLFKNELENLLIELFGADNSYQRELSTVNFTEHRPAKSQPVSIDRALTILKIALNEFGKIVVEGDFKERNMKIEIGGNVGILNTGTMQTIGDLNIEVNKVDLAGHHQVAEALKMIAEGITNSTELSTVKKDEALQQMQELARQASLPSEKRATKGVITALLTGLATTLGAAGGLATVWNTWGSTLQRFLIP